jgi:hypothetical protein
MISQRDSLVRVGAKDEPLWFILQVTAGAAAFALAGWLLDDRFVSGFLGFLAMWAAMYPFARKTWAADLPVWRYAAAGLVGTTVGAGLLLLMG